MGGGGLGEERGNDVVHYVRVTTCGRPDHPSGNKKPHSSPSNTHQCMSAAFKLVYLLSLSEAYCHQGQC